MQGKLVQTEADLKANRDETTLMSHEFVCSRRSRQEALGLLFELWKGITSETLDCPQVDFCQILPLERRREIAFAAPSEHFGEALEGDGEVGSEIADGPWGTAGWEGLNIRWPGSGEVPAQLDTDEIGDQRPR
ncbi:MAG: hypothetical protein M3Z66_12500 [Chloroflexota bacterium]|nr:hypothetical protein [Chloroflexota bacterium]